MHVYCTVQCTLYIEVSIMFESQNCIRCIFHCVVGILCMHQRNTVWPRTIFIHWLVQKCICIGFITSNFGSTRTTVEISKIHSVFHKCTTFKTTFAVTLPVTVAQKFLASASKINLLHIRIMLKCSRQWSNTTINTIYFIMCAMCIIYKPWSISHVQIYGHYCWNV